MPDFLFIKRGYCILRLNFADVIWRWQFASKVKWIPDSITKFGWAVKISPIHDEESPIMCVGCLIIFCNPVWEITPSILESSCVVMSLLYKRLDFALKSSRATVRKELSTITESRFNSSILINESKLSVACASKRDFSKIKRKKEIK